MRIAFIQEIIDIIRLRKFDFASFKYNKLIKYIKNKRYENALNIDNLINKQEPKKIFITTTLNDIYSRMFMLKPLLKCGKLVGMEDLASINFQNVKFLLAFGFNHVKNNIELFLKHKDKPIIFVEEAFLRSITMHMEKNTDIKYEYPRSVFLDDLGFHFDVHSPSRLEVMLNDKNLVVSEEQKQEARKLIDILIKNKLTKYNHQPIYKPEIGNSNKPKVLVIEQATSDSSIYRAGANDKTFMKMLNCAIKENPNCDIIIKTHPEQVSGRRGGLKGSYYHGITQKGNIYPINIAINPYSLLEVVDKVYVCSSMLGFEAVMAGKEVHTFGGPSYAGWGFTKDRMKINRRKNQRSIEEFVYIMYFKYARYINENGFCSIYEVIDTLLKLRDEYFKEKQIKKDLSSMEV